MIELSYEQAEDIGLKYVRDRLEPVCPYGVRYLKNEGFYGPGQAGALKDELENVALLLEMLRSREKEVMDLRHALSGLKDLSGSFRNCENQALTEVELFELLGFCLRIRELIPLVRELEVYPKLCGIDLEDPGPALKILDPGGIGLKSFFVEDERTPALAKARKEKRRLERLLKEREEGGASLLEERRKAAIKEEIALKEIYAAMSLALRPLLPLLRKNAAAAGRLDGVIAKALLALRFSCVKPQIGGEELMLKAAVHPELEAALAQRNRRFTPLSLGLPRGVTVLTGANMGGKSIALKTVLLNTALALGGCFVFAEAARIPLFSRIEVINRDFSDAGQGLSSFGGEILRLKEALERLKEGGLSLFVMDELARGTNALEGAAIVKGTVGYLADKEAVTLLATHYDGAAKQAARHYQVKGLAGGAGSAEGGSSGRDGLRLIEQAMDYGLIEVEPGEPCPRDAFAICRLLGLPEEILPPLFPEEK